MGTIEGPVHVDSLPTDVVSMSIILMELLGHLAVTEMIYYSGYIFHVESGADNEEDNVFDVEFKYKKYKEFEHEQLSHVEFLWFKLNVACQYMEDNS